MARLRYNNALGTLGASLTAGGTTITFGTVPSFATIVPPDFIPLVLEPPGSGPSASFEIVHLTDYTAGASTGTIVRGQEGTAATTHANGSAWVCAPTVADLVRPGEPAVSPFAIPALYAMHAYWPLQDEPGVASATELVGGTSLTNNGGTFGGAGPNGDLAVSLPSGDYLVSGVQPPGVVMGPGTALNDVLAFWIFLTALPASQGHFLCVGNVAVGGLVLDITTAGKIQAIGIGGGSTPTSTTALALNTWTRVAFSVNNGFWFNGVLDGTTVSGMTPNALNATARVVVNGDWNGSAVVADNVVSRIAKLASYALPNAADAARIAVSDYYLHKTLVGA